MEEKSSKYKEMTKQYEERMAFAKKLLLGGGGPKTQTRQYIGDRSSRQKKNPWAGGFPSYALGVGVDQIGDAQDELAKHGVSCEFDPESGAAIMESQEHYRKVCRATGMYTGRDGFHVPGPDGGIQETGRGVEREKARAREELLSALE